jgi:hypothetical protein
MRNIKFELYFGKNETLNFKISLKFLSAFLYFLNNLKSAGLTHIYRAERAQFPDVKKIEQFHRKKFIVDQVLEEKGRDRIEHQSEKRDGAVGTIATVAAAAITTCGTVSHGPAMKSCWNNLPASYRSSSAMTVPEGSTAGTLELCCLIRIPHYRPEYRH